jgi:prevent-host-death family protein
MPTAKWKLQDAKARFSEVVRLAKSQGPQHVTVHGREEVVIVSAQEFAVLKGADAGPRTGQAIIDAFSELRGLNIARMSVRSPVRPTPDFNSNDDGDGN